MSELIRQQIKSHELAYLYDYWMTATERQPSFSRADLKPAQICECLPNIVILDVEADGRFRYRFVGTAVDGLGGEYLTNRFLDEVRHGGLCAATLATLQNVVTGAQPSYSAGECKGGDGMTRHYERIAMPLRSNGRDVDNILVGLTYTPVMFPGAEELELAHYG